MTIMTPHVQELGQKLCDALGLPKRVVWFELRVACDELVTVKCEYYPERNDRMPLEAVFAQFEFEVVRREPVEVEQEPFNFDAWLNAKNNAAHAALMDSHRELSGMDARLFCHG
jgi:hypothetical protein